MLKKDGLNLSICVVCRAQTKALTRSLLFLFAAKTTRVMMEAQLGENAMEMLQESDDPALQVHVIRK